MTQPIDLSGEFTNWFMTQWTAVAGNDFPVCTVILYNFCQNDLGKFDFICKQMENAYEAGKRAATAAPIAGTPDSP